MISLVPFRTSRGPLFPKQVTVQEIFFAVSYSKLVVTLFLQTLPVSADLVGSDLRSKLDKDLGKVAIGFIPFSNLERLSKYWSTKLHIGAFLQILSHKLF